MLRYVVFDVADLDRAARFWTALLGVDEQARDERYVWLSPQTPEAPGVVLQAVAEPKVGKARCHVDLVPADRQAARDRALSLGATLLEEIDEPGYQLTVLADPDGIEFCLTSPDARPGRSSASPTTP